MEQQQQQRSEAQQPARTADGAKKTDAADEPSVTGRAVPMGVDYRPTSPAPLPMTTGLNGRCLVAVPKKGRLAEKCVKLMEKIDIRYTRQNRLDIALSTNMNIGIVFLPAADIALYVAQGRVDCGITGQDVVAESQVTVDQLMELGIGKCRLCVQAPIASRIADVKELIGKRIVTSFPNLSKRFFHELAPAVATTISNVSGSVEVACTLGLADAIVDLVESGATMDAHGLEMVHVIMHSQFVLIGNPRSQHKDMIGKIQARLRGVLTAEKYVMIEYNVARARLADAVKITPGQKSPTICPLEESEWLAVKAMIPAGESSNIMDQLEEIGAEDIFITEIKNCRVSHSHFTQSQS